MRLSLQSRNSEGRKTVDSGNPQARGGERLSVGVKLGYGVADFGMSLCFNLPAFFLLYYFTDVFFIPAAASGLILFFAKIWDALISPVMGYVSDHTHTRWGRKRPYLAFGAPLAALSIFLVYASPAIAGEGWRIAYAMGSFTLFCTLMTIIIVPFGALTADLTADSHERSVLSAFRVVFAISGTLVAAGATRPLVVLFGGTGVLDEAKGFRTLGLLYGLILVVMVLASFFSVRERNSSMEAESSRFRENLHLVLGNRPFLILTLGVMMHQIAINTMSGVVVYFFKYSLRAESMIPYAFLALMTTSALSIPVFLWISKTRGKKLAYNLGMGIMAVLCLPIFLYAERSIVFTIVMFAVVGLGLGTVYLSPWAMIPDTVEYSQWKTGLRREGILYGFFYFAFKLSVAIPGILVGTVLRLCGYAPNTAQNPGVLLGIKSLLTIIPAVFVVAGIVCISLFPIDEAMHLKMRKEIEESPPISH